MSCTIEACYICHGLNSLIARITYTTSCTIYTCYICRGLLHYIEPWTVMVHTPYTQVSLLLDNKVYL